MPQLTFALEDWYRIPIGGQFEYYTRPNQPYTIVIDKERNQIVLVNGISFNTHWYFQEYMSLLEKGKTQALNQANMFQVEMLALLSEDYPGHHPHFYLSQQDLQEVLEQESWRYTAYYQVTWANDSNAVQVGWLGIRNPEEYRQVLNTLSFLTWPDSSLEYQKAVNVLISYIGVIPISVVEVEITFQVEEK